MSAWNAVSKAATWLASSPTFRHDPPRPAGVGERVHRLKDLLLGVTGRQLDADARFAARHHRVAEPDDVDPRAEEVRGQVLGQARLAQHDRHDRMDPRLDGEP